MHLSNFLLIVSLMVVNQIGYSEEFPPKAEDYYNKLIGRFSEIKATQISYFVIEQNSPEISPHLHQQFEEFEAYQVAIIEKMKSGNLSDEEKEQLSGKSIEDFETSLQTIRVFKENKPLESLFTFSTNGYDIRLDIKRLNVEGSDLSFSYNGQIGVYSHPATNRVTTGSFLTDKWTSYGSFARFGSSLDIIQKRFPSIVDVNPDKRSIVLDVYSDGKTQSEKIEFFMLDDDPFYWKECIYWSNDERTEYTRKFVCEEFKEFSGLKIPQVVHYYRKATLGKNLIDHEAQLMTLIEVKVNDECNFGDDFFSFKPEWKEIMQLAKRH